MGAIAPAIILLGRARKSYDLQVFPSEMTRTFLRSCLYMIPLSIILIIYIYVIEPEMQLKDQGMCSMCWFSYFFTAFIVAGLLEESLKFFVLKSLQYVL